MSFPTYEEALVRLQRYCAYQERCHNEVRTKLIEIKCYGNTLEEVMTALIQEDYLNELRYARTFVNGKYRLKGWGRNKIKQALQQKFVSEYCIRKGLAEIDEQEYKEVLEHNLRKYQQRYRHLDPFVLRGKIFQFGILKGYTQQELNTVLDSLFVTK